MADLCFVMPVDMNACWISGSFGEWYGSYYHRGVDIAGPYGQPIYAPAEGRRIETYNPDGSFGYACVLDHESTPWYSILAHMAYPPIPAVGQLVRQGQLIGYMDSTGMSSGNHTHWQVSNSKYFPPDISTCTDPLEMLCEEDDMTPQQVQDMIDASLGPVVNSLNNLNDVVSKLGVEVDALNDAMVKRMDLFEAASGPVGNVRSAWERLRAAGEIQPGDSGGPPGPGGVVQAQAGERLIGRVEDPPPTFQSWRERGLEHRDE